MYRVHGYSLWRMVRLWVGVQFLASIQLCSAVSEPIVTSVTPHHIGRGGAVKITVYGSNFAGNQFNFQDENLGNKVILYDSVSKLNVTVDKHGSTTEHIVFDSPEGMEHNKLYRLIVWVNGKQIPDEKMCGGDPWHTKCNSRAFWWQTPSIDKMSFSGMPGDLFKMEGKIYTDFYLANQMASTNDKTQKFLRFYVGTSECSLLDDKGNLYQLALNSNKTDVGKITCKIKGSTVDFVLVSFIVGTPYGRCLPAGHLNRVSPSGVIYNYQSYTAITSFTPTKGSTNGGFDITVYIPFADTGKGYTNATLTVGGLDCPIKHVEPDSHIICTVPAKNKSHSGLYISNRGTWIEYWPADTALTLTELYTTATEPTGSLWRDDFRMMEGTEAKLPKRMTSFLVAPGSGRFSMGLLATNNADMYIDRKLEISVRGGNYWHQRELTLVKGQKYLITVVHIPGSGNEEKSDTRLIHRDTLIPYTATSQSLTEVIRLILTSTTVLETVVVAFLDFSPKDEDKVNEAQTVCQTGTGTFRLGMFGVYTHTKLRLSNPATASEATLIEKDLNKLPFLCDGESFEVAAKTDTQCVEVTFVSNRGDFDLLEFTKSDECEIDVTEKTKGVPNNDEISLAYRGVPSPCFKVSTVNADTLTNALTAMFGTRCVPVFAGDSAFKFLFEDYEDEKDYSVSGTLVNDVTPFCGRHSLKLGNSRQIFPTNGASTAANIYNLKTHKQLCLAYRGVIKQYVWLDYEYMKDGETTSTGKRNRAVDVPFRKDSNDKSETWYYNCYNLYDILMKEHSDSDNTFKVKAIRIEGDNSDVHVDVVFIGGKPTLEDTAEVDHLRMAPAQPVDGALIREVKVVYDDENDKFAISLNPHHCAHDFQLPGLFNGKDEKRTPESAIMTPKQLTGGGTLSSVRTLTASKAMTGSVKVTFKDKSTQVKAEGTEEEIRDALEGIEGIGNLEVTLVSGSNCANISHDIKFLSLTGDQPEMTVDGSGLLTPKETDAAIQTKQNGFLIYHPLSGDMVFTAEVDPQVGGTINDMPLKCSDKGICTFQWSTDDTPTVTTFTPKTGTQADQSNNMLTITGTKFGTSSSAITVTIGGVACTDPSVTDTTTIQCKIGTGTVGEHDVIVGVAGIGIATTADDKFTYTAKISSISPSESGLGGGVRLSITGYGFSKDTAVTIGTKQCTDITSTTDKITCLVPKTDSPTTVSKSVQITGGTSGLLTSPTAFNYDAAKTVNDVTVSPTTFDIHEGQTITLAGAFADVTVTSLYVGDSMVQIDSIVGENTIVGQVGLLTPGTNVGVYLTLKDWGHALKPDNNIPTVNIVLVVTSVQPPSGSKYGGTDLTLAGQGFGLVKGNVKVTVGENKCDVQELTSQQIICRIERTGNTHVVTNAGKHSVHGTYYAWDVPSGRLNATVDDVINFKWTIPDFVPDYKVAVMQMTNRTSTVKVTDGLDSGTPSRHGEYSWRFQKAGEIHVWSGPVDPLGKLSFRISINVTERAPSVGEISVKVSGKPAVHQIASGNTPTSSTSGCSPETTSISGCTSPEPTAPASTNKLYFKFLTCHSPSVTKIDLQSVSNTIPRVITTATLITVEGKGFSTSACNVDVSIGDSKCVIEGVPTAESFQCKLSPSSQPDMLRYYNPTVGVSNRGIALIAISSQNNRRLMVISGVDTITPAIVSIGGKTSIVLKGMGFYADDTTATVHGKNMDCSVISFFQLKCVTPRPTAEGKKDVVVMVRGNPAICNTDTACILNFDSSATPTVTAVNPTTITSSGETRITLKGTKFGTQADDLTVTVGEQVCTNIVLLGGISLECILNGLSAGDHVPSVIVSGLGQASVTSGTVLHGDISVSSVLPVKGSTNGGTEITITGYGFANDATVVTLGDKNCAVLGEVTVSTVVCTTPAHAEGNVIVSVTSNSKDKDDTFKYIYSADASPQVSSVSPNPGKPGDTITISGSLFGTDKTKVTVDLDGADCDVTAVSNEEVTCTLGHHVPDTVRIQVRVDGLGWSNTNIEFQYSFKISGVNPKEGDLAGGQMMTVTGVGFDDSVTVTVCDVKCDVDVAKATEIICTTPPGKTDAQACAVTATFTPPVGSALVETAVDQYTYRANMAPVITSVYPRLGITSGGTTLTISGSGFSGGALSVTIAAKECVVKTDSATDSNIECVTAGVDEITRQKYPVLVTRQGAGQAREVTPGVAVFTYGYLWSSTTTWGGKQPPKEGESAVITKNLVIILDIDTPILKMILIQGGTLTFAEKDVELNVENIIIVDSGLFEIGTEALPHKSKATITLQGHTRATELPIYGNKVIALRDGHLNLHGNPVTPSWTRLGATAEAGDTSITLVENVNWEPGSDVVITTTGGHVSQAETEVRTIKSVSGKTITFTKPLSNTHHGITEDFVVSPTRKVTAEYRAKVGSLTRNIKFRGAKNEQWSDEIKACPKDFKPSQFAAQACFSGRHGNETGSDEYGGQIFIHQKDKDSRDVEAHFSNVELTHVGQAFRLGRYPIHFHLNGDMSGSYVRNCAIHRTFNRAVNIHNTHNVLIENNVVYNIYGGAIFLEDGVETGNTFNNNLAVFPRPSTSLLNEDTTPAAFWITNPNNTYTNNVAAGGTHFGFWFRMNEKPDGPSHDENVCPQTVPQGSAKFVNNEAHSNGRIGIWLFPNYHPSTKSTRPYRPSANTASCAVFEKSFAWNNNKGIEFVNFGCLRDVNGTYVQNVETNVQGSIVSHVSAENPSRLNGTTIVGKSTKLPAPLSTLGCTEKGVLLPYGMGFELWNVYFINFDGSCSAIGWPRMSGTCSFLCGGFTTETYNLGFINSPNKWKFEWLYEGVIGMSDENGEKHSITTNTSLLPKACSSVSGYLGVTAASCPGDVRFYRVAFNKINPASLNGKECNVTTSRNTSQIFKYKHKAMTHKDGWMFVGVAGETYELAFVNGKIGTNISMDLLVTGMTKLEDCFILKVNLESQPDRVIHAKTRGSHKSGTKVTCKDNDFLDWVYDGQYVKTVIKPLDPIPAPSGSSGSIPHSYGDIAGVLSFEKCFYLNCELPLPANLKELPTKRGDPAFEFSEDIWTATAGLVSATGGTGETGRQPKSGEVVVIEQGVWLYIEKTIDEVFEEVRVYGTLEFYANTITDVIDFHAKNILIIGGLLMAGWIGQNEPYIGILNIVLHSNKNSPVVTGYSGYPIGSNAVAVYGGMDLYGKNTGPKWCQLAATAAVGDKTITVDRCDVSQWKAGDHLIVTSTSYDQRETEERIIATVTGSTITMTSSLSYRHICEKTDGVYLSAAVGLLSRNIRIMSDDAEDKAFGFRILVSEITDPNDSDRLLTGRARLYNVEVRYGGQEGYYDPYDPRFALAFASVGKVTEKSPSIVQGNSFVKNRGSAFGAFDTEGLQFTNNVVFQTVGHAVVLASRGLTADKNLIAVLIWTGTFDGRREHHNFEYQALLYSLAATDPIITHNYLAGSQRAGYRIKGEPCDSDKKSSSYNTAVGCLMGFATFPDDPDQHSCTTKRDSITWKNVDYGFYYNSESDLEFINNTMADNGIGLFPMIIGPSAVDHKSEVKPIKINDSLFIGRTPSFDCTLDKIPSGPYMDLSQQCRAFLAPDGQTIALVPGQRTGATNKAPEKPCAGIMSYNTISGLTQLDGNTFKWIGEDDTCPWSVAMASNTNNDDLQHPVEMKNSKRDGVLDRDLMAMHLPNPSQRNPSDCGDMDCDGLKKVLVQDLDGTFLGTEGPSAIIPDAGYGWEDASKDYIGDNRIPKAMLTDLEGNRTDRKSIAEHTGIVRTDSCTRFGNTFHCPGKYGMAVIESLDSDSETRRLSPVAILSETGYIDLLNGPQDHGWCDGYTCQTRLSLFHFLFLPNLQYTIFLTSTTPDKMRFRILNAKEPSDANWSIRIVMYISNPYRIDVYKSSDVAGVQDEYVLPTNGEMKDGKLYVNSEEGKNYVPALSDTTGSNFVNRDSKLLTVILRGNWQITTKRSEQIKVSLNLPDMTLDEFFGDNLVFNLASLLKVDFAMIRIIKIVPRTTTPTGSRRRRREADSLQVVLEIGPEPTATAGTTESSEQTEAEATEEDTVTNSAASEMMRACQEGALSEGLGETTECDTITVQEVTYQPQVPDVITMVTQPAAQHEGVPLATQPSIRAFDSEGNAIAHLGIESDPWQLTVSLREGVGHSDAKLEGTLTIPAVNGWFTFTDLVITHAADGYILDFDVTYPSTASGFTVSSVSFDVTPRPLTIGIHSVTSTPTQNQLFSVTYDLRDESNDAVISEIDWRGHSFNIECNLALLLTTANLTGVLTGTFDTTTGKITLDDLSIFGFGPVAISCHVTSNPAEYDFQFSHMVFVSGQDQAGIAMEIAEIVVIRINEDFNSVLSSRLKVSQFKMLVMQDFANRFPLILITAATASEGSILVTFTIEGSIVDVREASLSLCNDVASDKSFTFDGAVLRLDKYMTVDGEPYYGVACSTKDKPGLHPGIIAAIVVAAVLLIALIVLLLVWKFKISPKAKTHDEATAIRSKSDPEMTPVRTTPTGFYYIDNGKRVFLGNPDKDMDNILFNKTGMNTAVKSKAPDATIYHIKPVPDPQDMPRAPSEAELYPDAELRASMSPRFTTPVQGKATYKK